MKRFVLDCSLTMAWIFEDEATEETRRVFRALQGSIAVVPAVLWQLEVWNVLLHAFRRGRLTAARVLENQLFLERLPVLHAEPPLATVFTLADRHGLTSYDAAYLALAAAQKLPIASLDADLRAAASREEVELFQL